MIKKILIGSWIACAVLPAISAQSSGSRSEFEEALLVVPGGPARLGKTKGFSWAEYCPDQTCDVIRTRRSIDRRRLAGLALAYYYYISDYSYLRSWKNDERLMKKVDAFLESQASDQCSVVAGRERSICMLRSLADVYRFEILFVRHDERKVTVQRLSVDEIIK